MFIVFIIGLFLLSIVFGVKIFELNQGNKIILKSFREQADERITFYWKNTQRQSEQGFVRLREVWLTKQWSTRRWLAGKLRKLSQHLHN